MYILMVKPRFKYLVLMSYFLKNMCNSNNSVILLPKHALQVLQHRTRTRRYLESIIN